MYGEGSMHEDVMVGRFSRSGFGLFVGKSALFYGTCAVRRGYGETLVIVPRGRR
jgi:hypothetical protein